MDEDVTLEEAIFGYRENGDWQPGIYQRVNRMSADLEAFAKQVKLLRYAVLVLIFFSALDGVQVLFNPHLAELIRIVVHG